MKKIAFLASGHAGSTMPLIKAFLEKGYKVDYYILCNNEVKNIEATDCRYTSTHRGVEEIAPKYWPKLSNNYIKSNRLKIYSVNTNRPFENIKFLNIVAGYIRSWQIRKICEYINEQNYCFVNFIGRYQVSDIIRYGEFVKTKYIVSLHEVCNHSRPDYDHPNHVLRYLFRKRIPIIVFSDKSRHDLKKYKGSENAIIYRENFGKFNSFKIYQGRKNLDLPDNYVLFIGRLTPYKGLRIFFEATKDLARKGCKFVVAGNGSDEALNDIKSIPNYTVINRYLTDEDFVELVERCSFVVCPYTSVSQSGIPQTVFVFNKTIVATDLDGFREIIIDGENGVLCPINDKLKLSENISLLINESDKREKLEKGVQQFEKLFPLYSWNEIADKYEKDFCGCFQYLHNTSSIV